MREDRMRNGAEEPEAKRRRNKSKYDEEYEEEYYDDAQDDEEYEEVEDEAEDEYDEDEPEYADDEYDDEVFSLEEDLKHEQRKQFVQYVCVAVAALVVVALALLASVLLTNKRIEDEKNAAQLLAAQQAQQQQMEQIKPESAPILPIDAWPESQFPSVPAFDSPAYETTVADGYARVVVPSSATKGYADYIAQLTQRGAKVYVSTQKLNVLELDGIEIHLLSGNQQNRIVLCDEAEQTFDEVDYRAFDLPTSFKLVSAVPDSAMGRVLTYRLAPVNKALEYANSLVRQYGWKLLGSFDMSGNTFYAVYTKNNLQMTLDYFSSSDSFTIKLDYVN